MFAERKSINRFIEIFVIFNQHGKNLLVKISHLSRDKLSVLIKLSETHIHTTDSLAEYRACKYVAARSPLNFAAAYSSAEFDWPHSRVRNFN